MGMGMGAKAAAADPFPGGSNSNSSFVILSVSVAGILAISLLLLAYYLFLTRCASWSWRHNNHHLDDLALHLYSPRLAPRRRGLDEAAIRRIPTLRYSHHEKKPVASECTVCLGEFSEGERLRRLPACLHAFHIDCIDAWLHATANCPLCRADVVDAVVADHLVIDIASPPGGAKAEVPAARSAECPAVLPGEEEGAKFGESSAAAGSPATASGGRRLRRSFFSFSHGRSSRSAILPVCRFLHHY